MAGGGGVGVKGGNVPPSRPTQLSAVAPEEAAVGDARLRTTSTPDSASFSRASFFVAQVPSRSMVSPAMSSLPPKPPS